MKKEFTLWCSKSMGQPEVKALVQALKAIDNQEGQVPFQNCPLWKRELGGSQVGSCYEAEGQLAASDGSLLAEKAGAGVFFSSGVTWNGPVRGNQTVFRGEVTGAIAAVKMSDPNQPLAVLIDSQAVLNDIRKCVRHLGGMDLTFHEDADLLAELVTELSKRKDVTTFVKCKSHKGDPMNDATRQAVAC